MRPAARPFSRSTAPALLLVTCLAATGCDSSPSDSLAPARSVVGSEPAAASETTETLARIRAATARYHRVALASRDGFEPGGPCVAAPGIGGMGFHYVDGSRLGDATIDATAPEVLLYEPVRSGLRLVGVEYLVIADAWDGVHAEPPELLDVTFDEHRGEETHGLGFDHYELHVWSWRHNAVGLTAPFNPTVSC